MRNKFLKFFVYEEVSTQHTKKMTFYAINFSPRHQLNKNDNPRKLMLFSIFTKSFKKIMINIDY